MLGIMHRHVLRQCMFWMLICIGNKERHGYRRHISSSVAAYLSRLYSSLAGSTLHWEPRLSIVRESVSKDMTQCVLCSSCDLYATGSYPPPPSSDYAKLEKDVIRVMACNWPVTCLIKAKPVCTETLHDFLSVLWFSWSYRKRGKHLTKPQVNLLNRASICFLRKHKNMIYMCPFH